MSGRGAIFTPKKFFTMGRQTPGLLIIQAITDGGTLTPWYRIIKSNPWVDPDPFTERICFDGVNYYDTDRKLFTQKGFDSQKHYEHVGDILSRMARVL